MIAPTTARSLPAALAALIVSTWVPVVVARAADAPSDEQARFFEAKVRPILAGRCQKCHGPEKQKSGLRLDSRAGALAGGDLGPAVVPGKPDESLLIAAVRQEDDNLKMPPSGKLAREQIDDLARWVRIGAPWPGADATAAPAPARKGEYQVTDKDRAHWAFRPVQARAVPDVQDRGWVLNPIDAFLLAKLESKGLRPNPPAGRRELIRRVTFDVTGLPPTPEEVDAFLADDSPTAYERLVDRLLASPHFGEKWGRHWLDLVRFAETNSYERDNPKPNAWRYRDYVIRALNDDKPYDRFLREQLAGDELPGGDDGLIATGFYRLGIWDDEPTDRDQARYDGLDDIVATTGQVFLGLTVDCARCHDHKIDPIPQRDYYRLIAFFQNVNHFRNGGPTDESPLFDTGEDRTAFQDKLGEYEARRAAARLEIEAIEREAKAKAEDQGVMAVSDLGKLVRDEGERLLGKEKIKRYRELHRDLRGLQKGKPEAAMALRVSEAGPVAPETFVLLRGNPHAKGDEVEPGFPTVLGASSPVIPPPAPGAKSSGRRTALADWITSPENPLTARVMVNRLWQHHFGRGIVRSPNNFGLQGDRPTHPELLDWLASELVKGGWRLKPIHRLILTSNAYRMSSSGRPEALAKDPVNDLVWRFDMRRLTGEEIRDAVLAVGGTLNPRMFGPGIYPELPAEVLASQSMPGYGWGKSPPSEQARRSVYIHVKRSLLVPILEGFDLAETDRSSPVRFSTTQPTQALGMLNGAFLNAQAGRLADRLRREAGDDDRARVRRAFRLALGREPTEGEVGRSLAFLAALRHEDGLGDDAARRVFALMVLNLNEFLYVD
ncbi:MAG TPA: PSD1 and planctomycete cytochrome C domain-containing protein [Isosphaeraceae bacterium]|jgi:mono/diheme cytochrome c family protein|nr:PSD1 and planctomycete cytochrome C domain-containing protein [Isosphaeraceae bacterium]